MSSTLSRSTVCRFVWVTISLAAFAVSSASAGQTARSKTNGAYMEVSGTDTSGCVWFYVSASKGGTTQAPETYLYYDVYNQCAGEWIAYGGGRIANASLKTTKKSATLTVSPAASAQFQVEGNAGSLSITVSADGLYSSTYSGHSRTEYAGHVYQSHGAWTSKSASAKGTIVGLEIANASAFIGQARDKYVEIDRGSR